MTFFRRETTPEATRRQKIAAIHVARSQLGMEEDTYRELLARVSSAYGPECRSAKDLDAEQLRAVLDEMRRLGAARPGAHKAGQYPGTPHNIDRLGPEIAKIEAQLADMKLPWSYADAIARRMYRIERVAWCRKPEQLVGVLAALHVEQEKRDLLARVEALCAKAGTTTEQLEADLAISGVFLRPDWRRRRPALKWLVGHLAGADA